jgi:hypothetical protein
LAESFGGGSTSISVENGGTWHDQHQPTVSLPYRRPRGVDELIRVAPAEFDLSYGELRSATAALVALQCRPTREVLDRA